jgi:threonine synthase
MFHVEHLNICKSNHLIIIMLFYSTNTPSLRADLKEDVMKGLPDDNGLFMPLEIPTISADFIQQLDQYTFQEVAYRVAETLLQGAIPASELHQIITNAVTFPAPVVPLDHDTCILELFHGPSLAFKDFGARFMAQTMSYFNRDENRELTILVATSGDTGGAVAAGFHRTPGIRVVILYPSGKVSPLQEKQLTTLGDNVTALEVDGTFDDCQALVKKAFLDAELTKRHRLSSANSINIARLIPQSFYYFEAYKQVMRQAKPVVFSVPSGNFGNLTAGLLAKRMGLPIEKFIAATNANDVVPQYLETGKYEPRPSVRTLSNAMDVGSPSNFARMKDLYGSTWNMMKADIDGQCFSDAATEDAIRNTKAKYNYVIDPHGAVGLLALENYRNRTGSNAVGIVLETAHPAKFLEDMERILKEKLPIPERLAALSDLKKEAVAMGTDFESFKAWLLNH